MSLANRLSSVVPTRSNSGGCVSCQWYASLPEGDRAAVDEWIGAGKSIAQLWEIAVADPDSPFPVSQTAFRLHVRNHHGKR